MTGAKRLASDFDRAAAEHQARQVAVSIAEQRLVYTVLRSPVAGVVSVRLADTGEVVAKGQAVLRIAELTRSWVRACLNDTDLARVKLGQAALAVFLSPGWQISDAKPQSAQSWLAAAALGPLATAIPSP